jgi:predicted DNA-binding transcriptional regulator YafY
MLVDAVETSRFIPREQSKALIEKLRSYAGKNLSGELRRLVYVEDRIKTDNDLSLENIDLIHKAINSNKRISFKYFDYTGEKKRVFRHDGKRYEVSPEALILSDDNYYLVAFDEASESVKHFRVDKMFGIIISEEKRSTSVANERFNPAEYSKKVFGMYGGKEELVTVECDEHLAGVIIDRFGKDQTFFKTPQGFKVSLRVVPSPNFYGWVLGFGKDMKILAPDWVREDLRARLSEVEKMYEVEK